MSADFEHFMLWKGSDGKYRKVKRLYMEGNTICAEVEDEPFTNTDNSICVDPIETKST